MAVAFGAAAPAAHGATTDPTLVAWCADDPIDWEDFLARPPANASANLQAAAICMMVDWNIRLVAEYDYGSGRWHAAIPIGDVEVRNAMDPTRSWAAPSESSELTLRHEQSHFDLSEVYCRKLELSLQCLSVSAPTSAEARTALSAAIHETAETILRTLEDMQDTYDEETRHGTHAEMQRAWDQRIAGWLVEPLSAP